MLKMFKKTLHNAQKVSILNKSVQKSSAIEKFQKFSFSASSHHSESEHEHSDHSEHSEHDHHCTFKNEIQEFNQESRQRIFSQKKENFAVEDMLNKAKTPLFTPEKGFGEVKMHENEDQYIKFLAENFERITLQKYPEYKNNLDKFISRIPDYDKMNAYQKEVFTLDAYLHWKLETTEEETRAAYDFKGTTLEQAKERFKFFESKLYFLYLSSILF